MQNKLFRQKSIDRVSSPEQLQDYMRVTNHGAWMVLAVAFVMLTTMISYLFGLIDPAMTRAFYERLLSGRNPEWLYPFISLMVLLCVIELTVV